MAELHRRKEVSANSDPHCRRQRHSRQDELDIEPAGPYVIIQDLFPIFMYGRLTSIILELERYPQVDTYLPIADEANAFFHQSTWIRHNQQDNCRQPR